MPWKSFECKLHIYLILLLGTVRWQDEPIEEIRNEIALFFRDAFQIYFVISRPVCFQRLFFSFFFLFLLLLHFFLVNPNEIIFETLFSIFLFLALGIVVYFQSHVGNQFVDKILSEASFEILNLSSLWSLLFIFLDILTLNWAIPCPCFNNE